MFTAAGKSALGTLPTYIEDVFSTYLYAGTGATQTITNGVDLAGKGGLVWTKSRGGTRNHNFVDTARGGGFNIASNDTGAQYSLAVGVTSFNANGYQITGSFGDVNEATFNPYVSWTFRKQAKFFDVVTYTGNGIGGRDINHNLGSAPGCIIVKCTSATSNWMVWHRSIPFQDNLRLNTTDSTTGVTDPISVPGWPSSTSTTQFTVGVGTGSDLCNVNGASYVAYLFAHDAGGFGAAGTDNVISCGSFTNNGSGAATVTLGYEPQWVLTKNISAVENWSLADNMRGMPVGSADAYLVPNTAGAEATYDYIDPTATGFNIKGLNASQTYIYIAIRRGPMRTPTSGTSVFSPGFYQGSLPRYQTSFPVDMGIYRNSRSGVQDNWFATRLLQATRLNATSTAAEGAEGNNYFDYQNGYNKSSTPTTLNTDNISWNFRRAPGFFDVVCYTGTAVPNQSRSHNLGVVPELIIFKGRSVISNWPVYCQYLNNSSSQNNWQLQLNTTAAQNNNSGIFGNQIPTSSLFYTAGNNSDINGNGQTYVAYLFATVTGVSKVGSYNGTGLLQTVPCGFTSGARFVLIKRTDIAGDWWVYDSARGITSGNDPYLFLNSTAAEVTGTNYVDTDSTGFKVTAAAPAGLNAVGGNYIFLAIA